MVSAADGVIRTVVGTGVAGFNGDGLTGTSTRINAAQGVVVITATHAVVRRRRQQPHPRVRPATGVVRTVAGAGPRGSTGDGGPGIQARLYGPRMIALDSVGNLYIADSCNHRIRRVGIDGLITDRRRHRCRRVRAGTAARRRRPGSANRAG